EWVAARAGVAMKVLELADPYPLEELWARDDLGCVFMCGYPWAMRADRPHLLAAPVPSPSRYGGRPIYFTDFVVRADSAYRTLEDTFGGRLAYSTEHSHSGYNAARFHLLAYRRPDRPTFYSKVLGPLHRQLPVIDAVLDGRADVGPVDAYGLDLLRRHGAERAKRVGGGDDARSAERAAGGVARRRPGNPSTPRRGVAGRAPGPGAGLDARRAADRAVHRCRFRRVRRDARASPTSRGGRVHQARLTARAIDNTPGHVDTVAALTTGGPVMRNADDHVLIPTLKRQLADGQIDRREFLRYAVLLGMSVSAANAVARSITGQSLVTPAAAQSLPRGGTLRLGMRCQDLKSPHTYSWVE